MQIEMPLPANSYNLFIGGRGKFMQWSVSQEKVINYYHGIMAGDICNGIDQLQEISVFVE
jgi:hypothetical protein